MLSSFKESKKVMHITMKLRFFLNVWVGVEVGVKVEVLGLEKFKKKVEVTRNEVSKIKNDGRR